MDGDSFSLFSSPWGLLYVIYVVYWPGYFSKKACLLVTSSVYELLSETFISFFIYNFQIYKKIMIHEEHEE